MLDNHDNEEKPIASVRSRANELSKKREAWEKGALQRSNDELYELLDECLQFYKEIANNVRKVAALNEYLNEKKSDIQTPPVWKRKLSALFSTQILKSVLTLMPALSLSPLQR